MTLVRDFCFHFLRYLECACKTRWAVFPPSTFFFSVMYWLLPLGEGSANRAISYVFSSSFRVVSFSVRPEPMGTLEMGADTCFSCCESGPCITILGDSYSFYQHVEVKLDVRSTAKASIRIVNWPASLMITPHYGRARDAELSRGVIHQSDPTCGTLSLITCFGSGTS
jgi:hypothetical protein